MAPTNHQEMPRLNIGIFIVFSDPNTQKRSILRFFFSTQKNCPVRIAGQYSKSKTDIRMKTEVQIWPNPSARPLRRQDQRRIVL
jgi:hypothetical protein